MEFGECASLSSLARFIVHLLLFQKPCLFTQTALTRFAQIPVDMLRVARGASPL